MLNRRLRLPAFAAVAAAMVAAPAGAQLRTFDRPRLDGYDVSYCGASPDSCGERMAAAWCRSVGYEYASDWAARAGIDAASRAVRLDDGAICEGAACESFAAITCGREAETFTAPVLGAAAANATVLAPNLRTTRTALESAEYRVLMPGCSQQDPGVFVCDSRLEYQHCRTLMISRMVDSCRAGFAFEGTPAEPRAAAPEDYELEIDSDARVRITRGVRGFGQIKGEAEAVLSIRPPTDADGSWCVQRNRYTYFPTGPLGGSADIGEPGECEAPMELSFEANEDDLIRAYDLCESFVAWGMELTDTIEVLAAGLFQIRSASPSFAQAHGGARVVIAPYVRVRAPLRIECRD